MVKRLASPSLQAKREGERERQKLDEIKIWIVGQGYSSTLAIYQYLYTLPYIAILLEDTREYLPNHQLPPPLLPLLQELLHQLLHTETTQTKSVHFSVTASIQVHVNINGTSHVNTPFLPHYNEKLAIIQTNVQCVLLYLIRLSLSDVTSVTLFKCNQWNLLLYYLIPEWRVASAYQLLL